MRLGRFSSVLLVLLLLIIAVFLAASMYRPKPELDADVAQVQGSPTPMATQSAIPPPTSIETRPPGVTPTVLPTLQPPLTSVIPGPTMNATEVAETEMAYYLDEAFLVRQGTVIAQSTNPTPTPDPTSSVLPLTGYKIEEVTLPSAVTWKVHVPTLHSNQLEIREITFDRFWRVHVFGGPFPIINNVFGVWIDDTLVGTGTETGDGLLTIVFDRTLINEGSRLGISGGTSPDRVRYLAEPIHIP